jgi:hypothetical protein
MLFNKNRILNVIEKDGSLSNGGYNMNQITEFINEINNIFNTKYVSNGTRGIIVDELKVIYKTYRESFFTLKRKNGEDLFDKEPINPIGNINPTSVIKKPINIMSNIKLTSPDGEFILGKRNKFCHDIKSTKKSINIKLPYFSGTCKLLECGGGGDCFYCSFIASMSILNQDLEINVDILRRHVSLEIRDIISGHIRNNKQEIINIYKTNILQNYYMNPNNMDDIKNEDIYKFYYESSHYATSVDIEIISKIYNVTFLIFNTDKKSAPFFIGVDDADYFIVLVNIGNYHFNLGEIYDINNNLIISYMNRNQVKKSAEACKLIKNLCKSINTIC